MSDLTVIKPEVREGKRGITVPALSIYYPYYGYGSWVSQEVWRTVVESQPILALCRDTITAKVATIDWRIEPKDSTKRSDLRTEIEYYTELFEDNNGYDYLTVTEWILGDALDLPFGAAMELVYPGDDPKKRLADFVLFDGATFFPTNNRDYPAVQKMPGMEIEKAILFPKHAVNRMYYAPRRNYMWRGWGSPPPERIYLAIMMLSQGDQYYWKILTDTPPAGILDLGDMEKETAEEWLASWEVMMSGQGVLKVPVLYEHTRDGKFIPFGRPPSEIMFDSITMKYASIACAGYGISLSDIGVSVSSNGGETLAGTIRQERSSKSKGFGLAKKKVQLFRNRMLPPQLKFVWIDPDEEQQVARGRAMLSFSAASSSLIDKRVISPKESRQMFIGMGLAGEVDLPEDIPEEDMKAFDELIAGEQKRENMLTATQPPSAGGQGEVRQSLVEKTLAEEELDVKSLALDNPKEIDDNLDVILENKLSGELGEDDAEF